MQAGVKKSRRSLFAAVLFALAILFVGVQAYATPAFDFRAFYCAGWTASQHRDPYRTEPLYTCERTRTDARLVVFARKVALPAPIPAYDILLFEAMSRLPFPVAQGLWTFLLAGMLLIGVVALCSLASLSFLAGFALWIALLLPSVGLGECIPIALCGIFVAALAARRGRWDWAAVGALIAMVEPHIGVPVFITLAICSRRTWLVLGACAIALAALSLTTLPLGQLKEYFLTVLPLHALSELPSDGQLSLSVILHYLGASDKAALLGGGISYLVMVVLAMCCAPCISRYFKDDAFAVAVPAAFAVAGGSFIHVTDMPAAIPLALLLVIHLPQYRAFSVAALVCLTTPWWNLVLNYQTDASTIIVAMGATLALTWELHQRIVYAVLLTAATAVALVGVGAWYNASTNVNLTNQVPAYSPAIDRSYPEASWAWSIAHTVSTGLPVSFLMRAPTWFAIFALAATIVFLTARIQWRSHLTGSHLRPALWSFPMNHTSPDKARLIALSFLMLFVELGLIRWLGANIVYLSYFSNFVLLGSFLGIGLGFLRGGKKTNIFPWAATALAFLVIFVVIFPVEINRSGSQLIYFGGYPTGLPIWITLPVVFVLVATVMAAIAQGVAVQFALFKPIEAYRLDIIGSLTGILGFTTLSFLSAPPIAWGALVAVVFAILYGRSIRLLQAASLLGALMVLGHQSTIPGIHWSPYYRISIFDVGHGVKALNVNGIPHQMIEPMAFRKKTEPLYFYPYKRLTAHRLDNVLIIGAGNGGDVAIALAAGARHVDAVEIDPQIYRLGGDLNPERPYADPRVTVHINDGRAFLQQSPARYDLILFALPDSLILVSGQSSLRLESYLFTIEAMRVARSHLAPGGVFGMYNYYREDWLVNRLAGTLATVYGHAPCVDTVGKYGHFALLMVGTRAGSVSCPTRWSVAPSQAVAAVDDDHPFLYLQKRAIPPAYLITIAAILLASFFMIRGAGGSLRQMTGYADLFFMGAAFLLLETKSVVQFALLFGTTWFVNALVFFGVLLSVLAAIEVSRRVIVRRPIAIYALLGLALALSYLVPQEHLLALPFGPRLGLAIVLGFSPIFLANVVFAQRFAQTSASTVAFASNLLGAMVGGVLEYSSLIIGYHNLLIVVGVLYGVAFICERRQTATVSEPAVEKGSISFVTG